VLPRISLFVATALLSVIRAQTPLASSSLSIAPRQTWEIPALGYSPDAWSILRFTNNTDSAALLRADVYCGPGDRFPLNSPVSVEPGKTLDFRIEAPTTVPVLCWARVTEIAGERSTGVQFRAFVERLKGNQLEDFERNVGFETSNPAWAIPERQVADRQLYLLNASQTSTQFTFCAADSPDPTACHRKGVNLVQRVARPREAVVINVNKFPKKYLITQSSHPGGVIVQVFDDQPGHRRVYTSESTISFGDPEN
jgi:hypothetical protein